MIQPMTRCLGEGSAGRVCERRERCARHRAIAADRLRDERTGLAPYRSHADLLCRHPNWAYFHPWEDAHEHPGA